MNTGQAPNDSKGTRKAPSRRKLQPAGTPTLGNLAGVDAAFTTDRRLGEAAISQTSRFLSRGFHDGSNARIVFRLVWVSLCGGVSHL